MGNNAAFSSFESSVLACYNKGVLDKELLNALAEPYRGTDIDRGGMSGELAKDGLDIDGIIFTAYGVTPPPRPAIVPKKWNSAWTPEQTRANDEWSEAVYDLMQTIENGWGWR